MVEGDKGQAQVEAYIESGRADRGRLHRWTCCELHPCPLAAARRGRGLGRRRGEGPTGRVQRGRVLHG